MNNPLICSYNPLKISKNLDHSVIKKVVAGKNNVIKAVNLAS